MSKVAIVTDSTAYIPTDVTDHLPISIVPLHVIWDLENYLDGIDILPDEFYKKLVNAKTMPSTSQPSPAAFIEVYSKLLDEGYDIISIHISSDLSGTIDSATQAKSNFPGAKIEVLDSRTTTMAMGFPVLDAARAAKQGATYHDCLEIGRNSIANSGVYFAVDTLEFLHRGGRIGGGAAFLGTLLDLKPLLEVNHGRIEAIEKVRSMSKAIDRMIDLVEKQVSGKSEYRFAIIQADAIDEAEKVQQRVSEYFNVNKEEIICAAASPVIGTHAGPGTIGIVYNFK